MCLSVVVDGLLCGVGTLVAAEDSGFCATCRGAGG